MTRSVGKEGVVDREAGFTLVELLVALMVGAIVLAAIAPAFYGTLRASASSDQRSVADGLAVAASEQIRSLPYYQVGYSTNPTFCNQTGSTAVVLPYASPMDTTATQTTVSRIRYQIHSCVYWVGASDGNSQAYKQSVVTILWGNSNQYTYVLQSALYPGGESSYVNTGARNNFVPPTTAPSGTSPPVQPIVNSAAPYQPNAGDTTTPTTTIQINWQPVNYTTTVQYEIEHWTGSSARPANPTATQPVSGSPDGNGNLNFQLGALSPGTLYYFDVLAVAGTQTSLPSNVVSATTNSVSGPSCTVSSIAVSPTSPVIDSGGNPVSFSSLSITVHATSTCAGLTVQYGLNGSNGQPQSPLTQVTLINNAGSFTGSASQSTWSASTYGFVVYQNGTATTAQANVTPCRERGNSGHC